MKKIDFNYIKEQVLIPVMAIILSVIIGGVIVSLTGGNLIKAIEALLYGSTGIAIGLPDYTTNLEDFIARFGETLVQTTPLIFCGLAVAFAFRCGLFNIGAEGQLLIGAICAAYVGYAFRLPFFLHIPLTIIAGIIGGGLWGGIAGYLKAKFESHEVINTIMLNYIALYVAKYLVGPNGPIRDPDPRGVPQTPHILETAKLWQFFPDQTRLSLAFILALLAAGLIYYLLMRTTAGYEIRAVGFNPRAANYGGIDVAKNTILAMFISGALAGLAGATMVTGVVGNFNAEISSGYGFDSIAVALLGKTHPLGVILAAFLFGALKSGAITMQSIAGTPKEIVAIVQGLVIIFVAADQIIRWLVFRWKREG